MDLDAPSTSAAAAVASPAVAEAPQASTSAAGEVATEGTAAVATTTRSSARGQSDSVRVVKQWNALDKAVQKFSEVLTCVAHCHLLSAPRVGCHLTPRLDVAQAKAHAAGVP